jgi:stage V sporulation protein T
LIETFDIAGYARISVDDEQEQKNISIENQKAIIEDYVKTHFPGSTLMFFEDRDRSGYTFDQREGYQEMRRGLMQHKYDILIIKDFSRFSRRNSRGLVELEDLRDAGVRIISIGDGIDFPNDDDWLKIQFQFLVNEMPVTDTSRKVRNVIKRRQADGEWICAAPYGYIVTEGKQFEVVPTEAATVRKIFDLYNNDGWGYKKIANYLTDTGVPTPRMAERLRKEAAGKKTTRDAKNAWAIVTVQGILDNDFYIGTLRQGKYTRAKINGKEVRRDEGEHIVIENHHQAIIDYRTFATTRALREKRSRSNYRGVKINDNVYSGFLQCGDCGSPLFAMSRSDLAPAYTCGTYHRRGLKGCTSHHIRVDKLDELLKSYVRKLADSSSAMLVQLNEELKRETEQVAETEQSADNLAAVLDDLTEELKVTKRQRIREIMKKPEQEASIEALYDEMEDDLQKKIDGLNHQIDLLSDKRNTIIQVNRVAKTAIDVFHDILEKDKLERNDLELLIDKILVFEDHLEIKLKTDIDTLLRCGTLEDAANFKQGTKNIESTLIQSSKGHEDKVFRVRVISDGDPLEIYTSREGEVIFKKYSLLGGLEDFAAQFCDALNRTSGFTAAVTDRDAVIAITGAGKRELLGKSLSEALSRVMEERRIYCCQGADQPLPVTDGNDRYTAAVAAPILCEGDVLGLVLFLSAEGQVPGEGEYKLAQTVSAFLGKHMES